MEEIHITGWLIESGSGNADDLLFIKGHPYCLAEELEYLHNKFVSCRYWISDKEITPEEMKKGFIYQAIGEFRVDFSVAYSEYTGYLWTNEDMDIGGHDLLDNLFSHIGKYLHLELQIFNSIPNNNK